jgi:hypothetical protein
MQGTQLEDMLLDDIDEELDELELLDELLLMQGTYRSDMGPLLDELAQMT